jgi:hypothetical protein
MALRSGEGIRPWRPARGRRGGKAAGAIRAAAAGSWLALLSTGALSAHEVFFQQAAYSVSENASQMQFCVLRTGTPQELATQVTVVIAAEDLTATGLGQDYSLPPGSTTTTFAAGETVTCDPVVIVNDSTPEGNETFLLRIVGTNPPVPITLATALVTILDDDGPPVTPTPGPTPSPTPAPTPPGGPLADLEVTGISPPPLPGLTETTFLWGVKVRNRGPGAAVSPRLTIRSPLGPTLRIETTGWSCAETGLQTTECGADALANGAEAVTSFSLDFGLASGGTAVQVSVASATPDPAPANNSAEVLPFADLHVCGFDGFLQGNPVTLKFRVTNLGPSSAFVFLRNDAGGEIGSSPAPLGVGRSLELTNPQAATIGEAASATATASDGRIHDPNPANDRARSSVIAVDCDHLPRLCPILDEFQTAICESRLGYGSCQPAPPAAAALERRSLRREAQDILDDLSVFYRVRDEIFDRSAPGRRWAELYYGHGPEITGLMLSSAAVGEAADSSLETWRGPLRDLVEGRGSSTAVTPQMAETLQGLIEALKAQGSPALRGAIEREQARLDLPSRVGETMEQALTHFEATFAARAAVPVAASIRGAGGSFFHTDLRILNPSTAQTVTATIRFRCAFGPSCDSETAVLLAPGQMRVFDDAVGGLFGAPGSFGAIEVEGDVFVDSRLYTPERGSPTSGMNAPGLTRDEAYAESVLTSLSHSNDPSRGFRTNVGVYNPNDEPAAATLTLHGPGGEALGRISRAVAARSALQINDVFREAGIAGDVPSAYGVVAADGVLELFAYAGVIDNRSQDAILVRGRNGRGVAGGGPVLLPVAASLPGLGGSYFRSDVEVFNPSATETIEVTARYFCAGASCGNPEQTFSLAPRQLRRFDDAVATLFSAPGTLGTIEFGAPVHVDSRLYTPSREQPSLGMYVPGMLQREAVSRESVVGSLSSSGDPSAGFRTNLGLYNPTEGPQSARVTIHAPDGTVLGVFSLSLPARSLRQVAPFPAAGILGDVPDAYAVVVGEGAPLLAYAVVADNRSQDPVFLPARRRERETPSPAAAPAIAGLAAALSGLWIGLPALRRRSAGAAARFIRGGAPGHSRPTGDHPAVPPDPPLKLR